MLFSKAKSTLQKALCALEPTGPNGFEGLVSDVLQEVTGQRFRAAKSGHQGGTDIRNGTENVVSIGLEAKRYQQSTKLGLDDLLKKIVDASLQPDPVDLWLLAATRQIPENDEKALIRAGERHGMGVLVLDWPGQSGALPDLAVLCALAPTATAHHFAGQPHVTKALAAVRAHEQFRASETRIRKSLSSSLIGFAAAQKRIAEWLEEALSGRNAAQSRLSGRHNLLEKPELLVDRPSVFNALDTWWRGEAAIAALIGEEGSGKTWSTLGWCHNRIAATDEPPIVLFASASSVDEHSVFDLVVRLLFEQSGEKSLDFWHKRLKLWTTDQQPARRILLIVDGLNQHIFDKNWSAFLQTALDPDLHPFVSVLLTTWPDSWMELAELVEMTDEVCRIDVGRFTDAELDAYLQCRGYDRSQFGADVLQLMRVPRLSALAIQYKDELAGSGDITAYRLAYEDWRHRVALKGSQVGLSHEEMSVFVRDLGESLRASSNSAEFSRRDILEALGHDSGKSASQLLGAVGELIAGRWLKPTGEAHRFVVDPDLAPFALGLCLAESLRNVPDAQVAATLTDFIDPYSGQALASQILKAAVTVALVEPKYSRTVRRELVMKWLDEPNFSALDFESYWRLIGLDPDLFLDIVDTAWSLDKHGRHSDEVLIKGLANAWEFDPVRDRLPKRVADWLGRIWSDPRKGQFIGRHDPTEPRAVENAEKTRENLTEWSALPQASEFPQISLVDDRDVSWMSPRVMAVLSYLPRLPFVDAILAWSLGRAIMASPRHIEEMSWVLRLNRTDPEETRKALVERMDALAALDNPIAARAADYLKEALSHTDRLGPDAEWKVGRYSEEYFAERKFTPDPGSPLHPANPEPTLAINADGLLTGPPYSAEKTLEVLTSSYRLERQVRSDPNRIYEAYNAVIRQAITDEDEAALSKIAEGWSQQLFLADKETRNRLRAWIGNRIAAFDDTGTELPPEYARWKYRLLLLSLSGADPTEQIDLLLEADFGTDLYETLRPILAPLPFAAQQYLISKVDWTGADDKIAAWLDYLWNRSLDVSSIDLPGLEHLVVGSHFGVADNAKRIAFSSQHPEAIAAISAAPPEDPQKNRVSTFWFAKAKIHFGTSGAGGGIAGDLPAEGIALSAALRPEDDEVLRRFNTYLREEVEGLSKPGQRSLPYYWSGHEKALSALVRRLPEELSAWLLPWIDAQKSVSSINFWEDFPLMALCRALLAERPEDGLKLYRLLDRTHDTSFVKSNVLDHAVLSLPDEVRYDVERNRILDRLDKDNEIFDFVRAAHKVGRLRWLYGAIRAGEASTEPWRVAQAYTLLGFCSPSEDADALWRDFETRKPACPWLMQVGRKARYRYRHNIWSQERYEAFLSAGDVPSAFADFTLAVSHLDGRCTDWLKLPQDVGTSAFERSRNMHAWAAAAALDRSIKSEKDKLKKEFLSTGFIPSNFAPWS